ncbi:MAG: hypothetical protein M2R45_01682 [Verrucomicrobia subdivision 3 bacterium]|nr:hypothetical protein [Limisphaerales bacterium]
MVHQGNPNKAGSQFLLCLNADPALNRRYAVFGKLVWMDLTDQGRFGYDEGKVFCTNTAFIMTGQSIKYLCPLLNSNLITWFMRHTSLNSGMGVTRWIVFTVEAISIPQIPASDQKSFIQLLDRILAAKAKDPNADITALEAEIDSLVYQLYGLTSKEIEIVEGLG